jgi:hypothetical protein
MRDTRHPPFIGVSRRFAEIMLLPPAACCVPAEIMLLPAGGGRHPVSRLLLPVGRDFKSRSTEFKIRLVQAK